MICLWWCLHPGRFLWHFRVFCHRCSDALSVLWWVFLSSSIQRFTLVVDYHFDIPTIIEGARDLASKVVLPTPTCMYFYWSIIHPFWCFASSPTALVVLSTKLSGQVDTTSYLRDRPDSIDLSASHRSARTTMVQVSFSRLNLINDQVSGTLRTIGYLHWYFLLMLLWWVLFHSRVMLLWPRFFQMTLT